MFQSSYIPVFWVNNCWGDFKAMPCFCRWNTYVVDGHDVEELCKAFWQAKQVKDKPTCIVAKTFKGKGLKSKCGFHMRIILLLF